MQAQAAELSGYAGNPFALSSYGASVTAKRSRHSEATAEFCCLFGEKVFKNSLF
jgi:hypothetical protein